MTMATARGTCCRLRYAVAPAARRASNLGGRVGSGLHTTMMPWERWLGGSYQAGGPCVGVPAQRPNDPDSPASGRPEHHQRCAGAEMARHLA